MISSWLIKIAIGAGLGAALGYFGQCTSGTCPLTSTWWRGAIYGGVLGLVFAVLSAGTTGTTTKPTESANSPVVGISTDQFEAEVTQASGPVVVDFYATWCGPCKALAPVLDELAHEFKDTVKFVKVDVDKNPDLARRFAVRGVPTLMFFKDGKPQDTMVGFTRPAELRSRIEALAEVSS